jgi:hypothetical protein
MRYYSKVVAFASGHVAEQRQPSWKLLQTRTCGSSFVVQHTPTSALLHLHPWNTFGKGDYQIFESVNRTTLII